MTAILLLLLAALFDGLWIGIRALIRWRRNRLSPKQGRDIFK
jgi:hypothetical protein